MRILNKIKALLYSIPFGMKAADDEILGSNPFETSSHTIEIGQEINNKKLSKHLLKGEVTQEVEELRYRNYKVEAASKQYEYVGNGEAVKTEKKPRDLNVIKFTQSNKLNTTTLLEEFKRVNQYGDETYLIQCTYNDVVRFKIEQFLKSVQVVINNYKGIKETKLHFSAYPSPYDSKSKPFINELEKLTTLDLSNETAVNKNDIATSMVTLSFSTWKASDEDDFTNYSFVDGSKLTKVEKVDGEYILTFEWGNYMRVPIDLLQTYYSDSMEKKYQANERKNVEIHLVDIQEKHFCEICGAEVHQRDYEILVADKMPIICNKCLKNSMA